MPKTYTDAERDSIMARVRDYCSTSISRNAECSGRRNDFITIYAFPYQDGCPRADFSWTAADEISRNAGRFNLGF